MDNYVKIAGQRNGSIVYVYQGFLYSKHKEQRTHLRLRCLNYKRELCKAYATLDKESNVMEAVGNHNHISNEMDIQLLQFRSKLKCRVRGTVEAVKQIYDEVSADFPACVLQGLPFNRIKSSLYKWRKSNISEEVINVSDKCSVCLGTRDQTWALRPCSHASFCGNCTEEILNRGQNCPLCRGEVTERLRIFLN